MFKKIKVNFRIREELNCVGDIVYVPEAEHYCYFQGDDGWINISCNSITGRSEPIYDKVIAQTAIDRTKKLVENHWQKYFTV